MNEDGITRTLKIRQFKHRQDYRVCWQAMKHYTRMRTKDSTDEVWLLEHDPVFTLGIREHEGEILDAGEIPVVKTDRGGLATYHGPGQMVIYFMLDLPRLGTGLKTMISQLEQSTIDLLARYNILAVRMENAPGVYVYGRKIASLGLRVQHGCTYHGLSLNVNMDLTPYNRIIPCGLVGMKMTDMKTLGSVVDIDTVGRQFVQVLSAALGYNSVFDDDNDCTYHNDEQ
ncbi:MAG: lipoyl(octanoyl) transferase LipB [Gammaproteobacteria bacterium]|nr:lipoyl(octanoyl) transferase LipB [Gammaproteobacteria bacterium]